MLVESISFAASATTGTIALDAVGTALEFLILDTPVGWVGLIAGGVIVVGAISVASMSVNNYVKENAGTSYDDIMKWLVV